MFLYFELLGKASMLIYRQTKILGIWISVSTTEQPIQLKTSLINTSAKLSRDR